MADEKRRVYEITVMLHPTLTEARGGAEAERILSLSSVFATGEEALAYALQSIPEEDKVHGERLEVEVRERLSFHRIMGVGVAEEVPPTI